MESKDKVTIQLISVVLIEGKLPAAIWQKLKTRIENFCAFSGVKHLKIKRTKSYAMFELDLNHASKVKKLIQTLLRGRVN